MISRSNITIMINIVILCSFTDIYIILVLREYYKSTMVLNVGESDCFDCILFIIF